MGKEEAEDFLFNPYKTSLLLNNVIFECSSCHLSTSQFSLLGLRNSAQWQSILDIPILVATPSEVAWQGDDCAALRWMRSFDGQSWMVWTPSSMFQVLYSCKYGLVDFARVMIEHARIQSISARRITCVDRNIRAARFSSQISPNETACQIHQTLKDRVTRFTVLRKEASTLRQPSFSFTTLLNVSSHVRHQDPLTAKIESLINLLVDSFLPQTMKLLDVSKS